MLPKQVLKHSSLHVHVEYLSFDLDLTTYFYLFFHFLNIADLLKMGVEGMNVLMCC